MRRTLETASNWRGAIGNDTNNDEAEPCLETATAAKTATATVLNTGNWEG